VGYRLSRRAEADVEDITQFITAENPGAARRLILRFMEKWALLETQPRSGSPCDEIGEGIRRVVVGSYLVFYRVEKQNIEILRVLHSKRNVTSEDVPRPSD
jgi:toxin ParE1/3/4